MRRIRTAMILGMAGWLLSGGSVAATGAVSALACVPSSTSGPGQAFVPTAVSPERLAGAELVTTEALVAGIDAPIHVYVHVITGANGAGEVSDARIATQMEVLNASYAPWGISFQLIDVDRTANDTWFTGLRDGSTVEKQAKGFLHEGTADDLNLYTANVTGGILGFSTFPWEYGKSPVDDGVVMLHSTIAGGSAAPYNEGDAAVQQVGHWLGLLNTFEGGCNRKGDLVDDTPAEKGPTFDCNELRDSCRSPGVDSVHNFMNFGEDACMDEFTPGQAERMGAMWVVYRQGN